MPRFSLLPAVALGALLMTGCEETISPETPQAAQSSSSESAFEMNRGNSVLGGAIRAADRTQDKINAQQERLNKMMDEQNGN